MVRFIHTGDWQLGMTRHFLSDGVQEKFSQARFDAIRTLGRLADENDCQFMVVCGDIFESNQVDRKTVSRAIEALDKVSVPVYLLPGNHDPLEAGSVFHSQTFIERKPSNVHVIEDTKPIEITSGVEIVGAPWTSKRPLHDLVARVCQALQPTSSIIRIFTAHGAVDSLSPDPDNPSLINVAQVESALSEKKIHYLALGDRHSLTKVGASERIWYSGSPEPTDYDEVDPGKALLVEIEPNSVRVKEISTGTWKFKRKEFDINSEDDIAAVGEWLDEIEDKERTVVKLGFVGAISLKLHEQFEKILEHAGQLFAAVEIWERKTQLIVIPEDADFSDLNLTGYGKTTCDQLREKAKGRDDEAQVARDALALLLRLSKENE